MHRYDTERYCTGAYCRPEACDNNIRGTWNDEHDDDAFSTGYDCADIGDDGCDFRIALRHNYGSGRNYLSAFVKADACVE